MPAPIPLTPQSHERLAKIAQALGLDRRAVVRRLIDQEYAKLLAGKLVVEDQPGQPKPTTAS